MKPMVICVMGVAGAGKSTVGQQLAAELHCEFVDADTLHSPANIEKMSKGIPLSDADRAAWLRAVHARMIHSFHRHETLVVACSALKQHYRDTLAYGLPLVWVYLKGSPQVLRERLKHRQHHFMKARMLASQFADLEEPTDAIVIDVDVAPSIAVRHVLDALRSAWAGGALKPLVHSVSQRAAL